MIQQLQAVVLVLEVGSVPGQAAVASADAGDSEGRGGGAGEVGALSGIISAFAFASAAARDCDRANRFLNSASAAASALAAA